MRRWGAGRGGSLFEVAIRSNLECIDYQGLIWVCIYTVYVTYIIILYYIYDYIYMIIYIIIYIYLYTHTNRARVSHPKMGHHGRGWEIPELNGGLVRQENP